MSEVLYDYHLAKSLISTRNVREDAEKQAYMNAVFSKHGITEADFDSSLAWYSRNPEEMVKIYDDVSLRMIKVNAMLAVEQEKDLIAPTVSQDGDSIDLWPYHRVWRMTDKSLENLLTFFIAADNFYQHNDTIKWAMDFHFLGGKPRRSEAPVVTLQVWYAKDSMIYTRKSVTSDGWQYLSLVNDTMGKIKSVQGSVYIPKQTKKNKVVLIDSLSLLRLHAAGSQEDTDSQNTPRELQLNTKRKLTE